MKTHEQVMQELKNKDPESYYQIIEESNNEIEELRKWGGKRSNAGRKKEYKDKVKETFDLEKTDVINLKEYAKKHKISKNKALHEAINKLIQKA